MVLFGRLDRFDSVIGHWYQGHPVRYVNWRAGPYEQQSRSAVVLEYFPLAITPYRSIVKVLIVM